MRPNDCEFQHKIPNDLPVDRIALRNKLNQLISKLFIFIATVFDKTIECQ